MQNYKHYYNYNYNVVFVVLVVIKTTCTTKTTRGIPYVECFGVRHKNGWELFHER